MTLLRMRMTVCVSCKGL